jgi:hypothetical protein
MTVTVPLSIRRGCECSIRSVKAKSRNELVLERATPSSIDEQSFLMQIRHGSGDKTLSHRMEFMMRPRRAVLRP